MSEICGCVNAVRVLPCPVEVTDVEAGVTIGYGAEVVQSWSGKMMCVGACAKLYHKFLFRTILCKSLPRNF